MSARLARMLSARNERDLAARALDPEERVTYQIRWGHTPQVEDHPTLGSAERAVRSVLRGAVIVGQPDADGGAHYFWSSDELHACGVDCAAGRIVEVREAPPPPEREERLAWSAQR